jgi:hypothetical protein
MEVQPIYAICALVLLAGSVAAVFLWDRIQESFSAASNALTKDEVPEGNIRGFFFLLWVLILAAFISFAAPNLFRFSRLSRKVRCGSKKCLQPLPLWYCHLCFFYF